MRHENGPARNAFARLGLTYQSVLLLMTENPLIPDPPSLHFPACLNAAGRITLRFKRLSGSGDGDCSSLKDRHRLKLFLFSFFLSFFFSSATYGWALMSTSRFLPPSENTTPRRQWEIDSEDVFCLTMCLCVCVCVCVCFPGWWAPLWPSKWARTLRTSAPQMWPTWLVGVPRLSNVVFIPTEKKKRKKTGHYHRCAAAPEAPDGQKKKLPTPQ